MVAIVNLREQQGLSEGHFLSALQVVVAQAVVADRDARRRGATKRTIFFFLFLFSSQVGNC